MGDVPKPAIRSNEKLATKASLKRRGQQMHRAAVERVQLFITDSMCLMTEPLRPGDLVKGDRVDSFALNYVLQIENLKSYGSLGNNVVSLDCVAPGRPMLKYVNPC